MKITQIQINSFLRFYDSLPMRERNCVCYGMGANPAIKTLTDLKRYARDGRMRNFRGCGNKSYDRICAALGVKPKAAAPVYHYKCPKCSYCGKMPRKRVMP